jgi:hypothetical protein
LSRRWRQGVIREADELTILLLAKHSPGLATLYQSYVAIAIARRQIGAATKAIAPISRLAPLRLCAGRSRARSHLTLAFTRG